MPRRNHPTVRGFSPALLLLFVALGLSAFESRSSAQAIPALTGAPQLYVQRGQTIDVTLSGKSLKSVDRLALTHARGVQVSLVKPAPTEKPADGTLHLRLSADADAMLGDREMRLIGPSGVSAPLRVMVGQYPEFVEKEPNNTPDQAQDVIFPVALAGKIQAPGDIDCFRFTAAKGQTLVFDVHAARVRSQLDPLLTIHNEAGRELATRVDLHDADPTVLFEVPADGRYILSVRDLQYRGGEDFTYHIDAGPIPYVQSVLPMSAQPGKLAEITPLGVNLVGVGTIPLDLTYAAEGAISVRARASAGMSNPIQLAVNELATFVDNKPGHSAQTAVAVTLSVDISGRIDQAGDENFYAFHVPAKQVVALESVARRVGSPVEAMLTLRDSRGTAMQVADSAAGNEASITRELPAGDYQISIRDLFFNGGPRFAYRLQIRFGGSSGPSAQDFVVRFLPDAPRINRGGNSVVFVDLQRKGEFKGDVTVTLEDLPPGVTCPPLVINDKLPGASGMLTFSAAADAPLGSFPIKMRAMATVGSSLIVHEASPLLDGREVEQAYVTVLEANPVAIESIASLSDSRAKQLSAEADAIAARLAVPNAQTQAGQAEWEKKLAVPVAWMPLKQPKVTSVSGSEFKTLDDDSILAGKTSPDRDTYTVTANTTLTGITAIRLEALPDPSLPTQGPGRAATGNFVLSQLTVTLAPKADPVKPVPVELRNPIADFEQAGLPVAAALAAPKLGKGWGISPRKGEPIQAVFFVATPVGDAKGSVLTVTLDHQYGQQHTLGHFRLSITNDPQAASKASVPSKILKALATPADKRSPAEKAQIVGYYKTIDPQAAVDSARLASLRNEAGARIEIARLEALTTADTPAINTERDKWEKSVLAGSAWLPLEFTTVKSKSGATLTKEPDDSILVGGINPAADIYTLVSTTAIKNITGIRIEALPDPRLSANGPGRAPDGNFILSKVSVFTSPKEVKEMKSSVEFASARATAEQTGHGVASLLSDAKDAGWGIAPAAGRPAVATFYAKEKFSAADASGLTIVLEQQSSLPQHTLGRFRIWVTSNPNPDTAAVLPGDILSILKKAADKRNDRQKKELSRFFREEGPSLEPARYRLAELKAQMEDGLTIARGGKFSIPFLLNRTNFKGDVKVSLKGFIAAREPLTGVPAVLSKSFKFDPLDVPAGKSAGSINVTVENQAELGPRLGVLRVESGAGDDMRVEYSEPFVITVLGK